MLRHVLPASTFCAETCCFCECTNQATTDAGCSVNFSSAGDKAWEPGPVLLPPPPASRGTAVPASKSPRRSVTILSPPFSFRDLELC